MKTAPSSAVVAAELAPNLRHLSATDIRLAGRWLHVPHKDIDGPPRGIVIGEMPGPNTSARLPLFPHPSNSAGGRLLKMSGLKPGEYLGRLYRINLIETYATDWDYVAASRRAMEIHDWVVDDFNIRATEASASATPVAVEPLRVLLLGQKVARAFGLYAPFEISNVHGLEYATIPHPSGRSLSYNSEHARDGARAAMLWVTRQI